MESYLHFPTSIRDTYLHFTCFGIEFNVLLLNVLSFSHNLFRKIDLRPIKLRQVFCVTTYSDINRFKLSSSKFIANAERREREWRRVLRNYNNVQ